MSPNSRTYIAIDLKSFYASVECVQRGLDPLTANLVVADPTRTNKTVCLAVTPSLKAYGIGGRARLFEVEQKVRQINTARSRRGEAPLEYIVAPPRMSLYMQVSTSIFEIYLRSVSAEDMQVYSVDEVFIDATDYLRLYKCTARELTMKLVREVLRETGITATAGIGSNLYLAKVAMDIVAKHSDPDADGVRIAELDEMQYRRLLWGHQPLTDFWRVGRGTAAKLESVGIRTMGELCRRSLQPRWEEFFYRTFGVAAEIIIDHAWGWEPCTMQDIKNYRPKDCSLSSGQVLKEPYSIENARTIAREMTELLSLDLVSKKLITDQLVLNIIYDTVSLEAGYKGPVRTDHYGRKIPKPSHGSFRLGRYTSSTSLMLSSVDAIFDKIAIPGLFVRGINIAACHVRREEDRPDEEQLSLFPEEEPSDDPRERRRQEAILEIKRKFGKNAILKGMNFEEGATTIERNAQIGGHKA